MKRKQLFLFFAIILLLCACEVKMPKDVIPPAKMEQLLYDYHLVQSMTSEYASADYKEKLFFDYVFEKHHVTRNMFDASMGWYNRYPKHLQKIYANLEERLNIELEELSAMGAYPELAVSVEAAYMAADSAEMWVGARNRILNSNHLNSYLTFSFEVPEDSSFVAGDSLSLSFDVLFVDEGRENISQKAHTAVFVKYANGLSDSEGFDITSSGSYNVAVTRNKESNINSMSGFVYYSDNDSLAKAKMLLGNISLKRICAKPDAENKEGEEK